MKLEINFDISWKKLAIVSATIRPISLSDPYTVSPVQPVGAIIDTGAALSVVRRTAFETVLRAARRTPERQRPIDRIQGVSGTSITVIPFEVLLELYSHDGRSIATREATIYAADNVQFDFLIGNDLHCCPNVESLGTEKPFC